MLQTLMAIFLMQRCHTSNDISNTDFIIRDLDLNQEPEMPRQSKNFGKMLGHN